MDRDLLESAKSGPHRRGKKELIRHLGGSKLSRMQAMNAKCYECDGMSDSGECDIETCPMYPFSHFGGLKRISARAGEAKQAILT